LYTLQGDDIIVIPGTGNVKHLEENAEATKVNLSSEEISEIRQIINSIKVVGNRYSDLVMKVGNHNYFVYILTFFLFLFTVLTIEINIFFIYNT
jgi:hypothetical protein